MGDKPKKSCEYNDIKGSWEFNKKFDNSKYTVEIPESDLEKYSETDYLNAEKKMNEHLLCQISEQRCRPYFCDYSLCIHNSGSVEKCFRLYRLLNMCIDKERKKVTYQFLETGVQPKS